MELMIDIHCHILYGVDDGVSRLEESLEILRKIRSQGVEHVILTPHYRWRMFETPQEIMEEHFQILQAAAKEIDINLYQGCEYFVIGDMAEDLLQKKRWTLAGSNYVLAEFSEMDGYSYITDKIYQLLSSGFRPILAHIERYPALTCDTERISFLRRMGAEIQVNADAVLGYEGRKIKKFCSKLLKQQLIDYIGSDCHGINFRPHRLAECAAYVERKYGTDMAETIFVTNPKQILGV